MSGFEFNLSEVFKGFDFVSDNVLDAAARGMEKAMEALHRDADVLAPELKGELRKSSTHSVTVTGYSIVGEVMYSAISTNKRGWRYNYALRLHEYPRQFVDPTIPGTGPKFLSRPLKAKRKKYEQIIAEEIAKELQG
jgi:hypothetical protein